MNRKIVIVDDDESIHQSFRSVLAAGGEAEDLDDLEAELFEEATGPRRFRSFELDFAFQGQEACALVRSAIEAGTPYALAFVDMRMPPGWDGLTTIEHLWNADPNLQVVLCTAYSDHSWRSIQERLGDTDRLLVLKKPFDTIEVRQLASAMAAKRHLAEEARRSLGLMQRAREQAEAANLAKGTFLASMSHELRTPLATVLGLAESLKEGTYGPVAPAQSRALDTIMEGGRHLLSLINDILDLSEVEAGKLSLELGPVPVQDLSRAALDNIRKQARQKGQRLVISEEALGAWVYTDSRRFRQILVNLLSNAHKFTPEGGQLGLATRRRKGNIEFCVWDTGIGIPSEHFEHLFEPFVQLDSALSRRYEGTGLGLALVAQLAEALDVKVVVESVVREGSRFTLSVPELNVEG